MKNNLSMEIRCLEAILDYNMTPMEARAYKVACIYNELIRDIFPSIVAPKSGKGDPRKKYLFKCCFKLLKETQHKMEDSEYYYYVRAQLDVIKASNRVMGSVPNITPNCLTGKKAWTRWLFWQKSFDRQKKKAQTAEKVGIELNQPDRIKIALKNDKKLLEERLGELTFEAVKKAVENRSIPRWIATKQLSPYYALLSPILNNWAKEHNLTIDSMFHLDFTLFKPGITNNAEEFFSGLFRHESRYTG